MGREEWNAIGKMLVYLIKRDVHYFPLNFSQAFISSCLFSEEQITSHDLLSSFKNFVALDEKDVIEKIGKEDFDDIKDSLILMLDDYNSKRIPSAENVNELLTEIAHAELIQKPRYIANCLGKILQKFKKQPLDKIENLRAFYKTKSPTVRGTINSISALSWQGQDVWFPD